MITIAASGPIERFQIECLLMLAQEVDKETLCSDAIVKHYEGFINQMGGFPKVRIDQLADGAAEILAGAQLTHVLNSPVFQVQLIPPVRATEDFRLGFQIGHPSEPTAVNLACEVTRINSPSPDTRTFVERISKKVNQAKLRRQDGPSDGIAIIVCSTEFEPEVFKLRRDLEIELKLGRSATEYSDLSHRLLILMWKSQTVVDQSSYELLSRAPSFLWLRSDRLPVSWPLSIFWIFFFAQKTATGNISNLELLLDRS